MSLRSRMRAAGDKVVFAQRLAKPSKLRADLEAKNRLLQDRFIGFHENIRDHQQRRVVAAKAKFAVVREELANLREALYLVITHRVQQCKTVHQSIGEKISGWREFEAPLHSRLDAISAELESLSERIERVDDTLQEWSEEFPVQIETRANEILEQVVQFEKEFDADQATREQEERARLATVPPPLQEYQASLKSEQRDRARDQEAIGTALAKCTMERERAEAELRLSIEKGLTKINKSIVLENQAREEGVAEVALAIEKFAPRIQASIASLSRLTTA